MSKLMRAGEADTRLTFKNAVVYHKDVETVFALRMTLYYGAWEVD